MVVAKIIGICILLIAGLFVLRILFEAGSFIELKNRMTAHAYESLTKKTAIEESLKSIEITKGFTDLVDMIIETEFEATITKQLSIDKEINIPNLDKYENELITTIYKHLSEHFKTNALLLFDNEYIAQYIQRRVFAKVTTAVIQYNDQYRNTVHLNSKPDIVHRY